MRTTNYVRHDYRDKADTQAESFLTLIDNGPSRAAATVNGTTGDDVLTGTSGDDVFNAQGGGTDRLSGLGGYDYFYFGNTLESRDRINGGEGEFDEVGLLGTYSALTITRTMFTDVEALFLISGGTYNVTLAANLVADGSLFSVYGGTGSTQITTNVNGSAILGDLAFFGSAGNDVFTGGAGNDLFRFRVDGDDVYDGGTGTNRISLFEAGNGIVFDLRAVGAQIVGNGLVTIRNIQDVSGTAGADTLTGTDGANWFLGNGGDDILLGLGGNDLFTVGPTSRVTNPPLATAGSVDGGRGVDIVDFFANSGNNAAATVSLQNLDFQNTGQGVYKLVGIEGITGTIFDDSFTGDSKGNSLFGNNGADRLIGGAGNDFLYGDAIYALDSLNATTGPQVIDDNLSAIFADTLEGGRGRDQLDGGGGDDILIGGADADTLIGGAGADLFTFLSIADSAPRAADTIIDFATGDRIDLSAIDADAVAPRNQAFHLGATPGRTGDLIVAFDSASNVTTVNLYIDGDRQIDGTILLAGNIPLTAVDFIF